MCTLYLSTYGYVWTRIHTYKNCQHGHIWEAHCGAEKKRRLLLSFHREMVISKMFLLLLSEEDRRVVAEKVWCCHGYLYLIHGGREGNVIRNFGRKFEHEFEHCGINSAFSPSRKSSKSYRKNDKWKSILFL